MALDYRISALLGNTVLLRVDSDKEGLVLGSLLIYSKHCRYAFLLADLYSCTYEDSDRRRNDQYLHDTVRGSSRSSIPVVLGNVLAAYIL